MPKVAFVLYHVLPTEAPPPPLLLPRKVPMITRLAAFVSESSESSSLDAKGHIRAAPRAAATAATVAHERYTAFLLSSMVNIYVNFLFCFNAQLEARFASFFSHVYCLVSRLGFFSRSFVSYFCV